MSANPNYKKFAILYVDDEEKSLKSFSRAYNDEFWILTANNAQDGFKLFEQHKDQIGILMTDQRMPAEKGVWLLEQVRSLRPHVIRILATGYSDMEAMISAVNTGAIYKFITKPWEPAELEMQLKRGLEYFMVQQERDQLLQEKTTVLHQMMVADRVVSLGLLAAGLSHHIRNSLVAVKTFLDLAPIKLQEEKKDPTKLVSPDFWEDYHRNAVGQVEKMNDLLKDLWLASERPPFQFVDKIKLRDVIERVVTGMKAPLANAKLQIANNVLDELPQLMVDLPKFLRLLELLLKDEIASVPAGSTVTFSAKVSTTSSADRGEIVIEMQNNGPTLPEESLRVMFDPFVVRSDSPQEYGINLIACYFIVHHHGGKIEARSAQPNGTVFSIRLPINPNQAPVLEQNPELLQKVVLNNALWEKMIASP